MDVNEIKSKYINDVKLMESMAESIYFKMFDSISLPIDLDQSIIVKALIIAHVAFELLFAGNNVNEFKKDVFILKSNDLYEKYFRNEVLTDDELFILNFSTVYLIPSKPFDQYRKLKYSSDNVLANIFGVKEIIIKYRRELLRKI